MSEYTFDVIPLTEGLDFNAATSLAKPGSLRDCLNYEFVDGAGLKRIDGMRLYDGNMRNKTDKIFFIVFDGTAVSSNAVYSERPWLYVESDDNPNKVPFGHIAWDSSQLPVYDADDDTVNDTTVIPFIRLDCPGYADPSFSSGDIKILNDAALTVNEGTFSIVTLNALSNAQKTAVFGSSAVTAKDEEDVLLSHVQQTSYVSSGPYTSFPASDAPPPNPVNSVWAEKLNTALFQIGDAFVCSGTCAKQVYPGDYVYVDNDYEPFLVLSATLSSGTWSSGTATLHVAPLRTTSVAENYSRSGEALFSYDTVTTSLTLYRDAAAAAITSLVFTKISAESNISSQPDVACMYRVDSELGALTNDVVFSVAEPATEGTLYNLTAHPAGVSAGNAEGMPLISGGAVKAIVPTKRGASYASAPTFTLPASGGMAATANNASLTKTINRTNWQFVHTGWQVPFREGNRKYGYFNKIDRYKDNDSSTYSASSSVTGLEATNVIYAVDRTNAAGFDPQQSQNGTRVTRWKNVGVWKTNGGLDVADDNVETAIGSEDDTNYVVQTLTDNLANNNTTATKALILCGLTGSTPLSDIAEGSSVKGLKVNVRMDSNGTTNIPDGVTLHAYAVLGKAEIRETDGQLVVVKQYGQPFELMNGTTNLRDTFDNATVNDVTFTAGGTDSLFNAANIPLEDLQDPGFCVGIYFTTNYTSLSPATQLEIRVDHVYVDAYYELPSVRLYFKSNATSHTGGDDIVLHGDVVDYVVSAGSLEAGDAEGYLTVVNLRTTKANNSGGTGLTLSNSTVPYYTIKSDMDIYQDSGLTVKVGETSGEMTFNGFDSYRTIKQEGSRYTSIRANFFANDEYESYFICSGAGRAGIWDGKYWSRIYAINPKQANSDTLDKPRHVGIHNFHLMLGYKSGSVLFSAPGEPNNFSAFDGAGEIGIGDKIHGFNRLQGNAFGVFCEESVQAITGTDASNFTTQILVPNEGALEYSVASFGNRVIYTSKTGITTLDQSEKYGNFLGRRLSFDVNPWLIPRITSGAGLFTQITDFNPVFEAGNGFVCAYAVPHKNQYRVWFKDGLQLWMTLIGDDQPKFTFAQYFVAPSDSYGSYPTPVIPNYVSCQSNNSDSAPVILCPDREFVYAVVKSNGGLGPIVDEVEYLMPGIYLLDVGDSFDGGYSILPFSGLVSNSRARQAIPHYSLINYQYLKNPFTSKTLRKVRLEGQTRGCAPLVVYTADGYKTSAAEVKGTTGTDISLPIVPLDELKLSFKPESTLANVGSTGRVLSILVVGEALTNNPYFTTTGTDSLTSTRTTVPTPSHYLQAMLVQFSEQGTEDA